jgi:3-deoxy-D-manno-octulosonate 8-phosphate phosphatase (KDO 8-P phosphatase)
MSGKYGKASGTALFEALPEETRRRVAKAKLLILDVDGVLTDGGLYYGADGKIAKRFNVQDGLGISIARHSGLRLAVITGQDQPSVGARFKDLGIEDYFPGLPDKRGCYETLRERHGLAPEEVAFLGDDWIDLPVMTAVGVPLAVANAQPEVRDAALYVTAARGGDGAVREAIRLVLYCQGRLDQAFAGWMNDHTS